MAKSPNMRGKKKCGQRPAQFSTESHVPITAIRPAHTSGARTARRGARAGARHRVSYATRTGPHTAAPGGGRKRSSCWAGGEGCERERARGGSTRAHTAPQEVGGGETLLVHRQWCPQAAGAADAPTWLARGGGTHRNSPSGVPRRGLPQPARLCTGPSRTCAARRSIGGVGSHRPRVSRRCRAGSGHSPGAPPSKAFGKQSGRQERLRSQSQLRALFGRRRSASAPGGEWRTSCPK